MKIQESTDLARRLVSWYVEENASQMAISDVLLSSQHRHWLENYLVLRLAPQIIEDISDYYMNLYYWLSGFYRHHREEQGVDVGLEQQISSLLEEISNRVEDFDWGQIQSINDRLDREFDTQAT